MFLRYGYQRKEASLKTSDQSYIIAQEKRSRIRSDLIFNISNRVRLKTRGEYTIFNNSLNVSKGFLLFEDIKIGFAFPLTINARFTVFNTDNYNSAIYQFENNAEGMFYSLPLFNDGSRWYLLAVYQFYYFSLSVRYAETNRNDQNSLFYEAFHDKQVTFQFDMSL